MRERQEGFTLLEILLVVVIIGMLVSVVVVRLQSRTVEARKVAVLDQIRNYATALDVYELDNGFYPSSEQGLQSLIGQPTTPPAPSNWKGPYLQPPILREDPWGSKYSYRYPGEKMPHSYDLFSPGPNKVEGDDDDIGNWQ